METAIKEISYKPAKASCLYKLVGQWKFGRTSIKLAIIQAIIYSVMLFACLQFFGHYPIDKYIQKLFFDFTTNEWLVSKENQPLRAVFYYGAKYAVAAFGIVLIALLFRDYLTTKTLDKQAVLFVILSLIIIPSTMAYLKHLTGIPCPYMLKDFGGVFDYVNFLNPHWPDGTDRPSCFPAGHPSGGFALMALPLVMKNKKKVTIIALSLGIIMSLYQMARGAHFLSHCLATFFFSMVLINIIYICVAMLAKSKKKAAI